MSEDRKITIKECEVCRQLLRVVELPDGRVFASDYPTNHPHECFDIPEGADLVYTSDCDDCPPGC